MKTCVRIVVLAIASCLSFTAMAQEKTSKRDDLDVTMQIIVDPNAKLPDEVVRRIPLPTTRSTAPIPTIPKPTDTKPTDTKPDAASKGVERAQETRELGREAAETARERARDAQERREEARNSNTNSERDRGPPADRPTPPQRPPRP